ncbi:hypothetical protein SAMN05444858_109187 [Micromonospora avicenniae]|uniref:Uncharacterized protein n=1 Tax=Micromonospora avicenniae TaxID=1198245 RepID=A0A1N7ALE7_9ACTN|nr:hypothetical protein SAMN05444858_109187 [Micromonospora avicenniae]
MPAAPAPFDARRRCRSARMPPGYPGGPPPCRTPSWSTRLPCSRGIALIGIPRHHGRRVDLDNCVPGRIRFRIMRVEWLPRHRLVAPIGEAGCRRGWARSGNQLFTMPRAFDVRPWPGSSRRPGGRDPRADRPQAGPPCGPPCAAFEPASRSVPSGGKFRHWPSRGWRRRGDRSEQDAPASYASSSTLVRGASSTMWASRDRRRSLDGRSVASRVNLVPHQDQQCCPGAPPWRFATAPARPAPVRHGEKLRQLAGEGVTRPGSESIGQVARPGGRMAVRVMSGGRLHYQVWLDGARITRV